MDSLISPELINLIWWSIVSFGLGCILGVIIMAVSFIQVIRKYYLQTRVK